MREFLLRGKRTDNGEWVCGYYTKARYFLNKKEMHIIFEPDVEAFPHCEFTGYEEVLPETVGQYTGLTDKNGVRIFEGDIVDYISSDVIGNPKTGTIIVEDMTDYDTMIYLNHSDELQIIGNIHDNPDILKGGGDNG